MKEFFREHRFSEAKQALINTCSTIIEEYQAQNLRLTLRQLYYQCVSRDIIPNTKKSYKTLGNLISDARLAGLLDWDAIEDRVRVPRTQQEFDNLADLAETAVNAYRLPRWKGQDTYCELWVEKDALAGVLSPLAREFHVTMMVNRGYSSQSAMYESANRFREKGDDLSLQLFYLGDHDPSGEDMVRDIRERFQMFGVDVSVDKIALTMTQVRQFRPPPNPAKITDPRAAAYIAQFGNSSWEVDALPPEVLARIIRQAFEAVVDKDKMDAIKAQEEKDKAELRKAVEKIMKKGSTSR